MNRTGFCGQDCANARFRAARGERQPRGEGDCRRRRGEGLFAVVLLAAIGRRLALLRSKLLRWRDCKRPRRGGGGSRLRRGAGVRPRAARKRAFAQSWPQKPVRFIGLSRLAGDRHLGAAARREADADLGPDGSDRERGGAGGGVGAAEAARAAPDGYYAVLPFRLGRGPPTSTSNAKLNYDLKRIS